ncbi:hypothetical protein VTL71DRAFT_16480 [Oculimacula yallundae]|uniref:Heterokaryon incompatibility domain-containing protein n=1 Tax=Oculimacula yallundae TaxID=86028 RepID=A0ABR4CFE1_9HELO
MSAELPTTLSRFELSGLGGEQDQTPTGFYNPLPEPNPPSNISPEGSEGTEGTPHHCFIRLLTLLRGSEPDVVKCTLQVTKLADAPPYEALSYVWGDPDPPDYIMCNGHRKSVTPNLGSALKHLRFRDRDRLMWIDALCINQNDLVERSSQVRLMRDIYSRPWRVLVWLGDDMDNKAGIAISLLTKAAEMCAVEMQMPIDNIRNLDLLRFWFDTYRNQSERYSLSEAILGATDTDFAAADWICSHSWFKRIWIIQEIAFAPATVCIGQSEVPWMTIAIASIWLSARVEYLEWDFLPPREMLLLQSLAGKSYVSILKGVHRFEATDPRDKLFAVLGLSQDVDRRNPQFQPDYTKGVVNIYTELARIMSTTWIGGEGNALAVIYIGSSAAYAEKDNRFPSWVPRWDLNKRPRDFLETLPDWNVSGEKDLCGIILEKTFDPKWLSLKGFHISSVKFKLDDLNRESQLERVESLWNTLSNITDAAKTPALGVEDLDTRFVRTVTAGSIRRSSNGDCNWGPTELRIYHEVMRFRRTGQEENISLESMRVARQLAVATVPKAFFVTEDGRMGVGPLAMAVGDVLCVAFGHKVPYILRPVEEGHFTFVGPCYVDGIMFGETMVEFRTGKYEEQWLHII